jgi:hypothetical protein
MDTFEQTLSPGQTTTGAVDRVCETGIDLILNRTVFGKPSSHENLHQWLRRQILTVESDSAIASQTAPSI